MAEGGLTGVQKAALLVTLIGEEAATKLLACLEEEEVRRIAAEIARIKMVDPSEHEPILEEFTRMVNEARGLELAGLPLAKRLVGQARPHDADRILQQIEPRRIPDPDEVQPDVEPPELPETILATPSRRLAMLLHDEPPQTVALVLAHLPPRKAARIMAAMEPDRRIEVTRRMASIREVREEVVREIGRVLEERLATICDEPIIPFDGIQSAADALTSLGRATGQEIVEALQDDYPELAQQLRDMLFTFDMLIGLGDRDCQEVLKQVDRATLALALSGAAPEIRDLFFRNMSERAAQMLKEEMEFLGSPKVSEIEQAQRSIIELVLRLEKEGAISLEDQAVGA